VAANEKDGCFTVGLQANDPSALGMLAGLQHSGPGRRPLRVGMVWFDAHGDFNTPETSLSGMLGGMPVAIAAGLCLTRLRFQSGLDPALPTRYIVLAGVQDTDPHEQDLIDRSDIEMITVEDIKTRSKNIHRQMKRLNHLTDIIYVHVDLVDIVDEKDNPEVEVNFPEGPTSADIAAVMEMIYKYEKTAALGIASYPAGQDPNKMFINAAFNIVRGAIRGLRSR
jgi:arginase